jgi:hypothetical protein
VRIFLKGVSRPLGTDVEVEYSSQILTQTFTAEEVAARWDNEDYLRAALVLDGIKPGDLVQGIWEDVNTLDQGLSLSEFAAYLPDITSLPEIFDNASAFGNVIAGISTDLTYGYQIMHADAHVILKPGAVAYVFLNGDATPTTGEVTFKTIVSPP